MFFLGDFNKGTINKKPAVELLARVDPIGWFEEMKTIPNMDISGGYDDIYKTILIETPVGPYFEVQTNSQFSLLLHKVIYQETRSTRSLSDSVSILIFADDNSHNYHWCYY